MKQWIREMSWLLLLWLCLPIYFTLFVLAMTLFFVKELKEIFE